MKSEKAASFVMERAGRKCPAPIAAVLLGSGMGGVLSSMKTAASVPYGKIPGFPVPRVAGHEGRLDLGTLGKIPVAVFRGRFHLYEGLRPTEVAAPVLLAKALGVKLFVQTSAVGGIGRGMLPGTFVVVRDHMNFAGRDPIADIPLEERSPMFPDMSDVYPEALRKTALAAARRLKIPLKEGVLAVTHGPSYETPAEVRRLRAAGADVVCMSGLCESAFASYAGMPVLFLLSVTNRAAGLAKGKLSHGGVVETAKKSGAALSRLLEAVIPAAAETLRLF